MCFNGFNSVYESILLRYKLLGLLFLGSLFESIISLALIMIYVSTEADNTQYQCLLIMTGSCSCFIGFIGLSVIYFNQIVFKT